MDICLTGIFNAKHILLLNVLYNAWPSSIRSYDLELDEAQSEVLRPGEHLSVQFLTRDNCDDHDNTAASHLARQTEQVELNRLTDVADLVSQCSISGRHLTWIWHDIKLCDTNPSIRSLNCSKLASEARNSSLSFSDWPGGYNNLTHCIDIYLQKYLQNIQVRQ